MKNNKLEVGDEIYTITGWHEQKIIVGTIDRTTKTMAFIGSRKFKIEIDDDGRVDAVPKSFIHTSYYLLTDAAREDIAKQEHRLKKEKVVLDWGFKNLRGAIKGLPLSKLERIVEVLEETE